MTPEGKVKRDIREYLASIGAHAFWPVQMGLGAATLDCLACVKGRFVGIEVKRPEVWKPTARQALEILRITKAGGVAFTTNDVSRAQRYIEDHVLGVYNPEAP